MEKSEEVSECRSNNTHTHGNNNLTPSVIAILIIEMRIARVLSLYMLVHVVDAIVVGDREYSHTQQLSKKYNIFWTADQEQQVGTVEH